MGNEKFTASSGELAGGGSPKSMYTWFLLGLCKNFYETMRDNPEPRNIDAATTALISFCINKEKRENLWTMYEREKGGDRANSLSASVKAVGELMSYLGESLELEEESYGGLL